MPKVASWHEIAKKALKEIGTEWGYNVSESEKEIVFGTKFSIFRHKITGKGYEVIREGAAKRKPHTLSYKPDGVWKKGRNYRAIFEIECLDEIKRGTAKRKYAIGSLMLAYLAMIKNSVKNVVFVTNNENLYREIKTFKELISLEHGECIICITVKARDPLSIKKGIENYLRITLKK
jgi:hypothetical protein